MTNPTAPAAARPASVPFPRQAPAPADFSFSMLPDSVAADGELSSGAKVLFAVIFSSVRRGHCFAGNDALADRCGLSVIQVRRLLKILEDRGLIVRDLSGKSRDEIRVPAACIRKIHGGDQDDATSCIKMIQGHASKRCTELESRVENLEDGLSIPPDEEFDPMTLKHFGRNIALERAERG